MFRKHFFEALILHMQLYRKHKHTFHLFRGNCLWYKFLAEYMGMPFSLMKICNSGKKCSKQLLIHFTSALDTMKIATSFWRSSSKRSRIVYRNHIWNNYVFQLRELAFQIRARVLQWGIECENIGTVDLVGLQILRAEESVVPIEESDVLDGSIT